MTKQTLYVGKWYITIPEAEGDWEGEGHIGMTWEESEVQF